MASSNSRISFHGLTSIKIPDRKKLRAFILSKTFSEEMHVSSIDFIFCDDNYLLAINKQFLKHEELTDIITFDLSEKSGIIISEIYISVDRVRENANQFGVSINNELHRVMFHGLLHLCGYNDKTASQRAEMRVKETEWLSQYFDRT